GGWRVTDARVSVFFFQAEDGIRDRNVTGVQTCALPIFDGLDSAVGPQIGPADAGRRQPHHRVGGFDDPRVLSFGHVDLARGVHDHGTHDVSFGRLVRCLIDPTTHRRAGGAPVGGGTARDSLHRT